MSAIRIGAGSSAVGVASATNPVLEFLGRWVKWIPADVIAIYAAAVSQMQPKPEAADPTAVVSWPLWAFALVATPVVVLVAAYLAGSSHAWLRAIFSIPAFIVWSSTIPHSAWADWKVFTDNQIAAYAVLAILSLIFPPLFDRWLGDS